ncbi:TraB/GumN family protein [Ruixingdingia sedimenti]|uniref:TraB/GumN family protein n=1 Tax=Ruixingdingia sedimenti TaxID=3073604 RepID=A0ABU1F616_9RHOB|nr:TraB/GumN family protein [Xinfangfangia sp. LG-4]MDR5652320.1 TraB/GumN family protein [Xinfangfangia sp. LG-4]
MWHRLFLRLLLAGLFFAAAQQAAAACAGRDLIAALPDADRRALYRAAAAVPYPEGNIWRAQRGDAVIHLVGTYHLDDPRHDALMDAIAPLLSDARLLLVEAGPEEQARLTADLAQKPDIMFLTEGPTLPELLPEADWQAVMAAMRARGVPGFMASKFRPWYVAMLLGLPPCALEALKAGAEGLDNRLIAAAQARGLPVAALEPHDTLFRIFEGLDPAQELGMIRATLLMAEDAENQAVTLANAYFRGQSRLIWEFTRARALHQPGLSTEEAAAQMDLAESLLMTTRNRAWIPVLTEAAGRGPVLAAFGALHLPGDTGVLALLAAEGFTIARLDG